MLISGSIALQFFERAVYPESDLDLYVEIRYYQVIAAWLISIGYTYKPRPGQYSEKEILNTKKSFAPKGGVKFAEPSTADYKDFGVADVYDFHKSDPDDCKIQLVVSHYSPLEPILRFHSSTLFKTPLLPPVNSRGVVI